MKRTSLRIVPSPQNFALSDATLKALGYISLLGLSLLFTTTALAQSSLAIREQALLEGVGFNEQPGELIASHVRFTDHTGESVTFSNYLQSGRPVILNFAYYNCPMICSVMLDQLAVSLNEVDLKLGTDYDVVTVSFSPDEGTELAEKSRETFRPKVAGDEGWEFLTGSDESITELATSTGFRYKWIEENGEYAHPAALIFLSGDGKITRYLHGLMYPAPDVKKALLEAGEGRVGTVWDQVVMYCFRFDPTANSYVIQATNLMKLAGLLTVVALVFMLTFFWVKERRRHADLQMAS